MPLRSPLNESTIVITGASSGVGALTALALSIHHPGVRLVLAARGAGPLRRVASACRTRGAAAIAVPTDVADEDAVFALADAAMDEFGRMDAWINNAGVAQWAPLIETPAAELRRTIDTDLFGYVHGVRAALPRLTAAGGGVLINNASVLGVVTMPYIAGYVMSKHAVRALSEVVRQELRVAGDSAVSVCTLLPGAMDTPLFGRAGNRTGRGLVPPPPVYRPERAALRILRLLRHPRREAYVGTRAMLLAYAWRIAPGVTGAALAGYGDRAILAPAGSSDGAGTDGAGTDGAGTDGTGKGAAGGAGTSGPGADATHTSGNLFEENRSVGLHGGWLSGRTWALRRAAARGAAAAVRELPG